MERRQRGFPTDVRIQRANATASATGGRRYTRPEAAVVRVVEAVEGGRPESSRGGCELAEARWQLSAAEEGGRCPPCKSRVRHTVRSGWRALAVTEKMVHRGMHPTKRMHIEHGTAGLGSHRSFPRCGVTGEVAAEGDLHAY